MNLAITDNLATERQAFADLAKDFAAKKLMENWEEHDRYPFSELYTDAIEDAGIVGFYGVNLPCDFGGVEMNTSMIAVILERLSETDSSMAGIIFTNAAALEIINAASESGDTEGTCQEIKSIGTVPLAFQAFTSPEENSIPILNKKGDAIFFGNMKYLTLGNIADYAIVPARMKDEKAFSYYLIDLRDKGVKKSEPVVSLGLHACPSVDVTLENVPVQIIGKPDEGAVCFNTMKDRMSICIAAMSLGIMRASFKSALEYTEERYQGGRQIIDWPQVRMMLANMAVEVKIAETCFAMAMQELDMNKQGWEKTAAAAAIHLGELATRTATDGVQLFGGNGYTKDYPQEKRMRDARQAQCLLGMMPLKKINYIARIIEENK